MQANRMLGALSLSLAMYVLGGFASRPDDVVEARSFRLVDDDGKILAELGLEEQGPALRFFDREGGLRLSIVHDNAETGLFVHDAEGQIRVGAAQFSHGGGGFALHGPEGKGSTVLYHKGKGSLTFYGDDGSVLRSIPE